MTQRRPWIRFALPALLLGLLLSLNRFTDLNLQDLGEFESLITVIICAIAVFVWQARSIRFGLGMAALIAAGYLISNNDDVLQQTRNFYGVLKVLAHDSPPKHILYNGTTVHGEQAQDTAHSLEPLSYYHPDGPLGQLFVRLDKASLRRRTRSHRSRGCHTSGSPSLGSSGSRSTSSRDELLPGPMVWARRD